MNKTVLEMMIVAVCLSSKVALAQASPPSAPSPLNFGDKFRLYLRQTYSLPSVLVPAAFAGLDQAADSPNEWRLGSRGYLNRLGTQRGQFQIGAFCAFGVGAALHEDPRFFPSGKHGMWRRTEYVVTHTVIAHTDRGTEMPAFGNYATAIGAGFSPSAWLPQRANSATDSLKRSVAMLGMNVGVNMGIEFGSDDRRFFREKVLRAFHRSGKQTTNQLR
ncbi:MAG: hypothetical protein ABR987_22710 [Terracidiphilus sp.]